jgi:hypothetical protein
MMEIEMGVKTGTQMKTQTRRQRGTGTKTVEGRERPVKEDGEGRMVMRKRTREKRKSMMD